VQTLTEIVAAVVVHSSAAAYSHFGVTMDAQQVREPTPAERTVARSAAAPKRAKAAPQKVMVKAAAKPVPASRTDDCPDQRAHLVKA
jgi:hypothetical protein